MRARNIKPGFFKNEYLAEISHSARLLWIGLWCFADRKGRLEFRPKKIRAELFPYEKIEIQPLIDELARSPERFITLYEIGNIQYLQINNFEKHQNPHCREKASTIPAPDKAMPCTGKGDVEPGGFRIPDSGFRIPEEPEIQAPGKAMPSADETNSAPSGAPFDKIKETANRLKTKGIFKGAFAFVHKSLERGANPDALLHTLCRMERKQTFEQHGGPWAYGVAVLKIENGNFNEREFQQQNEQYKSADVPNKIAGFLKGIGNA